MRYIPFFTGNRMLLNEYSHNWLYSFKFFRVVFLIALFFSWSLPLFAQEVTISGFVTDNSTGETLIGANVYDSATYRGTATNNRGFFSLTLENGMKTIQISYVGYEPKSYKINLVQEIELKFSLDAGIKLDEVQIRSIKTESDFLKGRLSLPMIKLQELPSLGGETDLIKALTTLPGIAPANEGSSDMVVRGGGSDQNLFILDGIPVYNTGHLFNFISVFNPEAIKRVDFYKGTFPSKYGGRLSSVTDITFRDGNSNKFKGSFDIGLINSKLTLEGPINEKTTFILAARSTYLDVFTPFRRAIIKNKNKFKSFGETVNNEMILYTFADLNFKVNHKFNSKNSVSFNLYSGVDYYRILNKYELQKESNRYTLLNNLASIKSTHVISSKMLASAMIGFTSNSGISKLENTQYNQYMIKDPVTSWPTSLTVFERAEKDEQKSFVRDISTAIDFSYYSSNSNTFYFGMSGIRHFYQPGIYTTEVTDTINNRSPLLTSFRNKQYNSFDGSLYFEDEINYHDRIHITGGVRLNLFKSYDKIFKSLEPRLSISVSTLNSDSFIFSFSQMTQSNHALIKNDLLMYKTIWVPSLSWLPPEKSDLLSAGYIHKNEKAGYSLEIEAFYKTMKNLVEYKINYLSQYSYYNWENSLITGGLGQAYGLELSGEKTKGIFTGNINYTLSWTNRKFTELNNGKWFPFIFDRRHVLNITGTIKVNESWKLSFLWTLSSGHRINFPVAYINSNPYAYGYYAYDGLNTRSLPIYHRLDLGAEWQKKRKNGEPYGLKFSLYNAYYRLNAYYLYVNHDYQYDKQGNLISSNTSVKKMTFLPIIPSINFFYKF
jgi:hypothetical protein